MAENDNLRYTTMSLKNGSGAIPALGFGTLIPDPVATRAATKAEPAGRTLSESTQNSLTRHRCQIGAIAR